MAGVKQSLIGRSTRSGKILYRYAICKTCAQSVSRGGKNTKTFNTSNLAQHLKSKHQDDYKEFEKHKALKAEQADQIIVHKLSILVAIFSNITMSRHAVS